MKKLQAWLPILFALVLIAGLVSGYQLRGRLPLSQGLLETSKRSSLQEAVDLIRLHYVDPIATDSLTDDAVRAMLTHLDPHSVFIPARYLQEVNEDLQGNFEGIGVEFQIIEDTVNVVQVLPGGPSASAGVKVADKFLKVGDSVVTGKNISSADIKKLLRGEGGTKINITFLRKGLPVALSVKRGTIPLFSVDAAYLINDTTGYIHLNKFSGTSYEECMAAFEKSLVAALPRFCPTYTVTPSDLSRLRSTFSSSPLRTLTDKPQPSDASAAASVAPNFLACARAVSTRSSKKGRL